jgi:hypothetical protein
MENSSNEVSLRDYFEALLKAEAKRNDDRANAAETALTTAYTPRLGNLSQRLRRLPTRWPTSKTSGAARSMT